MKYFEDQLQSKPYNIYKYINIVKPDFKYMKCESVSLLCFDMKNKGL